MARYKLLFGSHKYENRTYQKGDELDIPVEHMERFGGPNRFSSIVAIPINPPEDSTTPPVDEEITISDLLLKPLPEIKAQLVMVNDVATLDAVQAEERKGKQRSDVYKAIEARKKAIKV